MVAQYIREECPDMEFVNDFSEGEEAFDDEEYDDSDYYEQEYNCEDMGNSALNTN